MQIVKNTFRVCRWPFALVLGLIACASPVLNVPFAGDACEAACAHRRELGCLEPALEPQCVPVCRRAAAQGWYDASAVARAERSGMAALGVRCQP